MADSPAATQPSDAAAAPATTDRPATPPGTTEPAAAEPATRAPATTAPMATESAATAPATTAPAAAEATTTEAAPTSPVPAPAPAPGQQIEAEDGTSVSDGASIDERISSYTASLASSAVDYPVEHGRRYHAFRDGAYFMPNDEPEMDRLDLAHATSVKALGDRLYTAPLEKDKVHTILDIGTGTGIWAMEMGDMFPNAEVFGVDLSAIQPDWVPPNVRFEIDDIESPWIDRKYDFIFCRYMVGAVADWPKLMKNVYDHLNPGGWAEFIDVNGDFYSPDGTYTDKHSTHKWITTLLDTIESLGRESRVGTKLEGWVQEAGFGNVQHRKFLVPIGPWAKDPYYQELGLMNLAQMLEGLEGFTMRMFCGVLGWTKTEAEVLLVEVRNELKKLHTFHAQFDNHSVCGQKPLEPEQDE